MSQVSLQLTPPYFYLAVGNKSDATNFGWQLKEAYKPLLVTVRVLRGNKMKKTMELFDEIAAVLQFPYYFGENWNAFDECLNDLDWLEGEAYLLMITDVSTVLIEESPQEFLTFIKILRQACQEWSDISGQASTGGLVRESKPFKVVFQCSKENSEQFRLLLQSENLPFQEFNLSN